MNNENDLLSIDNSKCKPSHDVRGSGMQRGASQGTNIKISHSFLPALGQQINHAALQEHPVAPPPATQRDSSFTR